MGKWSIFSKEEPDKKIEKGSKKKNIYIPLILGLFFSFFAMLSGDLIAAGTLFFIATICYAIGFIFAIQNAIQHFKNKDKQT